MNSTELKYFPLIKKPVKRIDWIKNPLRKTSENISIIINTIISHFISRINLVLLTSDLVENKNWL